MPDRRHPGGRGAHGARGRAIAAPRPILIHGSGGDHRVWATQTGHLGGAVAIDLPGHPSGDPVARLDELGVALAAAVASIDAPRALVGHSLGGAVALELARTRPELVDGLVVIAGGARLPVPDAVMERVTTDPDGERERLMAGFVADPGAAAARGVLAALEDCSPATLAADYAACRTVDLRAALDGIRVPVLVIAGGDDRLVPTWLSEELARGLPMARMVVVAGARHVPMADAAGTVNLLLAAYLARLELTLEGP
jgi:pimeloyl-ACP methyl ester carboxylesterase